MATGNITQEIMKVAMIQMHVGQDKVENIKRAAGFARQAAEQGADLIVLPEMFCCPYETPNFPKYAQVEGLDHWRMLSDIAKSNHVYLVAGSVPEFNERKQVFNTSFIFDRQGHQIAKHRKMHLFDIDVEGGQSFKESDTLSPGSDICVFDTEFGKMGVVICYDFRFPELSRLIVEEGARTIIVPAAFNMTTGPAHWEILFRNRALDNQVFTIGVAPARDVNSSYVSYGNSILVSPWGDVRILMDEKEGMQIYDVDLGEVDKVRKQLPLLVHRRKDIYSLTKKAK